MLGLLVKDTYLLAQRKQTLVLFLAISLLMGWTVGGSFIVGYTSFLACTLATSTISYDEADNGLLFLMSLPADKKTYACSKYLFGAIVCGVAWALSVVMMLGLYMVQGTPFALGEELLAAVTVIPVFGVALDIMIPIQLKFGAEKSRLVLALIAGVAVAFCGAVSVMLTMDEEGISAVLLFLDSVPELLIGGVLVMFCGVMTVISMKISCGIMEKKEF